MDIAVALHLAPGEYAPFRWVKLKKEVVIDVRNTYETRIGKFKGAGDPCTTAFRDIPSWLENRFEIEPRRQ